MGIFLEALIKFKNFLGYKKFLFVIAFGVITSFFALLETYFASRLVGQIEQYIASDILNIDSLIYENLLWGAVIISSVVLQYIYRYYLVDKNILAFYVEILKDSSYKALHIPYNEYLQKKSGEIFKRIERGREGYMNFFFFFYLNIIKDLSGLTLAVFLMFFIHIQMSLLVLIGVPIAMFIGAFFNKRTLELQNENNRKEDEIFGMIGDSLTNLSLVKILSLERPILKHFNKTEEKLLGLQHSISKRWAVANIYTSSLIGILRFVVILGGFYFILQGTLDFSELFLFFFFIGWIYYPLGNLFSQIRQLQRWGTGIHEYICEFEHNYISENINTGKVLNKPHGDISFNNVIFGYTDDKNILKNINFSIKSGEKIALVGNTGAGKSTIVNLLLRFWDIQSGTITIDGENISDIKRSSLRSHIGVVSQDNSLFNLSIEENLKFANPKATQIQLNQALKDAEASFVFQLKDGIKTVIGERGLKLSGGEKQRISIARLFLKNPEILILDEATSALDNLTEKKIEKALKKLMKGKTSIIIAHRLSTIQHVDKIFMLENGKIVEQGNYQELMNKKNKFYSLANPEKLILR